MTWQMLGRCKRNLEVLVQRELEEEEVVGMLMKQINRYLSSNIMQRMQRS
jgi:hypothetical protein